MTKNLLKLPILLILLVSLFSCHRKLSQSSMFRDRDHISRKKGKKAKKGVYDAGLNTKKPISVQIAKEYNKQNGNPKKAAERARRENEKKQKQAQKEREKHNKKVHVKIKTTKQQSGGQK